MKVNKLLEKAIKMRQSGYSLAEISISLKISKSTAAVWLKNIEISKQGSGLLQDKIRLGRAKGANTNKAKRELRWQEMAKTALCFKPGLVEYSKEQCKTFLTMLYWGEGAKSGRRLIFVNSDPELIKTYLFLLRRAFTIDENKLKVSLHLHSYHNQIEMIEFWSKLTGINKNNFSIYNKVSSGVNIKNDYKGCLSVRYGSAIVLDEIMLIIKRFQQAI